jgi:hypothetical protein
MASSSEKDDLYAGYAANAAQFEDWAASAAAEAEQYVCARDAWTVHFDLVGFGFLLCGGEASARTH